MTDYQPEPAEAAALDEQRALANRLTDEARKGCFCENLRKPCERHDHFEDGVLAALLEMKFIGWCDDPDWTDMTKTVGRLWHKTKPQMGGVPVYRLSGNSADLNEGEKE